ncbi:MAG: vapC [Enterovirga sp.]|jgi:tRNA(fMet)-specific endonuclease VapC|nr:vapC [Enterovirga sp.]
MAARFMLDTNVIIRIRQRRPASIVTRFLALAPAEAVMSAVSFGELMFGVEKSPHRSRDLAALDALLAFIPVEDVSTLAASEYGIIRSNLERIGQSIGANDLWIAAHARALKLTLVTGNEREFRRVPGLAVENWAAEPA